MKITSSKCYHHLPEEEGSLAGFLLSNKIIFDSSQQIFFLNFCGSFPPAFYFEKCKAYLHFPLADRHCMVFKVLQVGLLGNCLEFFPLWFAGITSEDASKSYDNSPFLTQGLYYH